MNGRDLTLGLVGALALGAVVGLRRGRDTDPTSTPAFRRWFKESQVVDAKGGAPRGLPRDNRSPLRRLHASVHAAQGADRLPHQVVKLGAAFVPMNRAHLFRWWVPEREGRPWFFWTRRDPSEPVGSDDVDESELDNAVRPLVMWCLSRGWHTTPSCEGHFVGTSADDGVGEALRHLSDDGRRIRAGTLTLRDSETEERLRPHIPAWVGPNPEDTRRLAIENNGYGCMGFVPTVYGDWSRLAIPEWTTVRYEGSLVIVQTHARSPEHVAPLWAEVGRRMRL